MAEQPNLAPVAQNVNELAQLIGALINPLAQQQASTQQAAIQADVRKFEIAHATGRSNARYGFITVMALILIFAGVIAALMASDRFELAVNAFHLGLGAIVGFLAGRDLSREIQVLFLFRAAL
jgi:hypothetical protein